ncbi:hypothetical protein M5689_012254 [Euphorbia peplus]|nr:hypothetical protein M5689_012254 [Euphorbia peplus]
MAQDLALPPPQAAALPPPAAVLLPPPAAVLPPPAAVLPLCGLCGNPKVVRRCENCRLNICVCEFGTHWKLSHYYTEEEEVSQV